MAAPVRLVVLRQKFLNFQNGKVALGTLHRRWAGSEPPPRPPRAADADDDAPLRFSTSGAAAWRARDTFSGGAGEDDVPWYQMPIVLGSTTALLVYFCVLREESDIDERLAGDALHQVPGLERQSLEVYVRHQEAAGQNVDAERRRLQELREIELGGKEGGGGGARPAGPAA